MYKYFVAINNITFDRNVQFLHFSIINFMKTEKYENNSIYLLDFFADLYRKSPLIIAVHCENHLNKLFYKYFER